jgi:hypothetical protein
MTAPQTLGPGHCLTASSVTELTQTRNITYTSLGFLIVTVTESAN